MTNILALILGASLTLAYAPFHLYPLAILAPAGLFALWLNKSPKDAFRIGFCFGFGLFTSGVYWVYISIHFYGDLPIPLAAFFTLGLTAILALFIAGVGYLSRRYFSNLSDTRQLVFVFPALWILIAEWLRCWVGCGFPWLIIGYSQTNTPLDGYAPILSVFGVSLAVLMTSGLLTNGILAYRQKTYQAAYFSLFSIVTIWTLGSLLHLIPWTIPNGSPITISLVQGNIPQSIKWSPEHVQLSLDRYAELSEPLWGKSDIIIWPEGAIPMPENEIMSYLDMLQQKAKESNTTLMLGIPSIAPDMNHYYNAVITLGQQNQRYNKRRLVPFGEYIPFGDWTSRVLDIMHIPMSNTLPGEGQQPLITINQIKILTAICFEVSFPELMMSHDPNLGLLLTVTNDAWFGDSIAKPQHLQMAAMRSIELGRPHLFVSNDGITAILNPDGQIQKYIPGNEAAVLTSQVQPMQGLTPWMRNGSDPIIAILLAFLILSKRRAKKTVDVSPQTTSFNNSH